MKKFLTVTSLFVVVVMLVLTLSSCDANKKFVGTWDEFDFSYGECVPGGETLVLANDGTGSVRSDGMSGSLNWSVEKDKIFMTISMCGITNTYEYTYEFFGNTLTLTDEDGEETVYRKR